MLRGVALLALLGLGAATGAILFLQSQGVTPRALAPYVAKRSAGHNPTIVATGRWLNDSLLRLDRGEQLPVLLPRLKVGAQPQTVPEPMGTMVVVASSVAARAAIAGAQPGDVIVFTPGSYRFDGYVTAGHAGSAAAPMTVRAAQPGTVVIEFNAGEGFLVSAPYWRFENLELRGACPQQSDCEHAFHVVGDAHHFAAVNNTIVDFNAHFKINGANGRFPDHGLVEANTLRNNSPRDTLNPVTPIDLVAASDWTIRGNIIADFIKGGGDRISYGAFAKGAGARTLFERNVIVCEGRLRGQPGQRVGLSLGGGATGKAYCRDGKCVTEQEQGVIRANLVTSCSDAGIYLNNAAASRIEHNTLVDTGGIDVRFVGSSADIEGNLVDGAIQTRNGGVLRLNDNLSTPIAYAYLGYHPLRRLLRVPETLDFDWLGVAPRRPARAAGADLCGMARPPQPTYGGFEEFRACLTPAVPTTNP